MSAPAWLEAVNAAYPDLANTLSEAESIDQWGEAYWSNERVVEEGQSPLEAQARDAIRLYDALSKAKLEIPAALRAFAPTAKMIDKAWEKRSDLDESDEDDVKEILKVDRLRKQLATAYAGGAKPERRPWQGPTQAPQFAAPTTVAKPKLERFWLSNRVFDVALSAPAFKVYCCLARHAGKSGICWPSRATLAKECQMQKRTVLGAVKDLRRARMVAVKRRFQASELYRLTTPDLWRITPAPLQEVSSDSTS